MNRRIATIIPVLPAFGVELLRFGALLGIALIYPWLCHQVNMPGLKLGPWLMPLSLPVLLAAVLLPWRSAVIFALVMPLVSFAVSSMPPFAPPIAQELMIEATLTVMAIKTAQKFTSRRWLAVMAGVLVNRITAFGCMYCIAITWTHQGLAPVAFSTLQGCFGLLVNCAMLPLLLKSFETGRNSAC